MHRRKSSKDNTEQENLVVAPDPKTLKPAPIPFPDASQGGENGFSGPQSSSPLKARLSLAPSQLNEQPPVHRPAPPTSAGPYRTSFGTLPQSPPMGYSHSSSPLRKSYTHARTMSSGATTYGSPMLSPPLYGSGSFPSRSITMPGLQSPNMHSSPPEPLGSSQQLPNAPRSPPSTRRHHQRIHSRNLSVFFPRPGSLPASAIAEDGDDSQEISVPSVLLNEAPVTLIPPGPSQSIRLHNPPGPRRLGEGFTFGGRPARTLSNASTESSSDGASSMNSAPMSAAAHAKRRGHHHKHSLSHNFFSFLEPGSTRVSTSPEQPWNPVSPFPASSASNASTFSQAQNGTVAGFTSPILDPFVTRPTTLPKGTMALSVVQFFLGAYLWVSGQQRGSLACTGLGYWVVFDSFGVALRHVLPVYLSLDSMQSKSRRPYGNARVETLFLFAQTIYLIFSSVYVCKEAVEHLLLSAGDGHHHHHGDEDFGTEGMQFPLFLIAITIVSLVSTCLFYDNHGKLLSTCGHRLPSLSRLFRFSRNHTYLTPTPTTPAAVIIANPFTIAPLLLSFALVAGVSLLPSPQHQPFDLLLALVEAVLTFKIAYPAAVVLGAVLLQTAPPRGMPGARMESFLRVMREIERHPLVLHLPAPHMWQLTPSAISALGPTKSHATPFSPAGTLVVTLELHVRRDTDDGELIVLTRWAHERCRLALGMAAKERDRDREDEAEITIGIVKG